MGRFYLQIKTSTFLTQPLPLPHITQFLSFIFWMFQKSKFHALSSYLHFLVTLHPTRSQHHPSATNQCHHATSSKWPFLLLLLLSSYFPPSCTWHSNAPSPSWSTLSLGFCETHAPRNAPSSQSAPSRAPFSAPSIPPNMKCHYFLVLGLGPSILFSIWGIIPMVLSIMYQLLDL